jgi:HK97 family phage prohead protease
MAEWTTSYVNDLPDSAFLYIAPGGEKDEDGKTKPRSLRYFPYKDASGKVDLPHLRNALARIPQSNLPSSVKATLTTKAQKILSAQTSQSNAARPPRDELVRAIGGGLELRDDEDHGAPRLVGHFARFGEWAEIDSVFEGHFLERVAPGAFKKTIAENLQRIRVLFQHGLDPQIGDKPLGRIDVLREDEEGPYYEVPLLDAPYVREILPGLRAGLYGASFRFSVLREMFDRNAPESEHNPEGLPERTLKEVALREFGPVTFPAYAGATAGVRSMTDEFVLGRFRGKLGAALRMDTEDLSTLAQMIELGAVYIDEQDETEDRATVPVMEGVLKELASLVPYEVNEDEAVEDEDGERSAPVDDAAHEAPRADTPRETGSTRWPKAPPDLWEV